MKNEKLTWAEVAYIVLKKNNKPMNYREITKEAIKIKKDFQGKTPADTLRVKISKDPRFHRTSKGIYGLIEWT